MNNGFYGGLSGPPPPSGPIAGYYGMQPYTQQVQARQLTRCESETGRSLLKRRRHPSTNTFYSSRDCNLSIRQEPKEALVTQEGKEKSRKPVDPPPILQLHVENHADPQSHWLQSPYLFVTCALIKSDSMEPVKTGEDGKQALTGSLVSSLHRLKDTNNQDGGFFVFGDVSVRVTGRHRLHFSLFDFHKDTREVTFLCAATTAPFNVVQAKDFRGLDESTYLSRAFSDQGVRLRLRKEPRAFGGNKRSYPQSQYQQPRDEDQDDGGSGDGQYDAQYQDAHISPKRQRTTAEYSGYDQHQSTLAVRPPSANDGGYPAMPQSYQSQMRHPPQYQQPGQQFMYPGGPFSTGPSPYVPMTTTAQDTNAYSSHQFAPNAYNTGPPIQQYNGQRSVQEGSGLHALPVQPYLSGTLAPPTDTDYASVPPELTAYNPALLGMDAPSISRPKGRYEENVENAVQDLRANAVHGFHGTKIEDFSADLATNHYP
ncbi:hypothetical protein EJ08DRAFT_657346 [Tothia fuscella]|uniref:Velvet domain-containing protein n=1 Tax=Tothia fuscella TaxID=1048955 RepID=A0A9P4P0V3_9PEZI|nr:hypothetical protein EJ08DRAFT_657346 [Tothia fuscella]